MYDFSGTQKNKLDKIKKRESSVESSEATSVRNKIFILKFVVIELILKTDLWKNQSVFLWTKWFIWKDLTQKNYSFTIQMDEWISTYVTNMPRIELNSDLFLTESYCMI